MLPLICGLYSGLVQQRSHWSQWSIVHSHLRFSQLFREPELIVEQWVTLYYMGAFTPAIWSTIAWTEKFNNGGGGGGFSWEDRPL